MAVGYQSRIEDPSSFEDDLAAQQEIARQMEEQKQLERRNSGSGIRDALSDRAKDELMREGRAVAKRAFQSGSRMAAQAGARTAATTAATAATTTAAGTATAGGAAVTSPVWITIAVVIAIIILLVMIVVGMFAALYYACNQSSMSTGVKVISWLSSWAGYEDICAHMGAAGTTGPGDIQQPTQQAPPDGTDLVAITGVPVDGASDPRLRPCMLRQIQIIHNEAQKIGIDFVITSAYRQGAVVGDTDTLSAHGRGEAVDIALRPKGTKNDPAFMKLVKKVISISLAQGFSPPQGDTLDEYTNPAVNATGGHIHIEYNKPANGGSYCTNPTNYDEYNT